MSEISAFFYEPPETESDIRRSRMSEMGVPYHLRFLADTDTRYRHILSIRVKQAREDYYFRKLDNFIYRFTLRVRKASKNEEGLYLESWDIKRLEEWIRVNE